MAELVDALDSKSSAERRAGSIPALGTILGKPYSTNGFLNFFSFKLYTRTSMHKVYTFNQYMSMYPIPKYLKQNTKLPFYSPNVPRFPHLNDTHTLA